MRWASWARRDGSTVRQRQSYRLAAISTHELAAASVCDGLMKDAVAMTRPKRHLCVIGDSDTISKGSKFLKAWMQHLEDHADLRYPNLADVYVDQEKGG
jgi:DNA polymerase alpha-associated DNA helicase A